MQATQGLGSGADMGGEVWALPRFLPSSCLILATDIWHDGCHQRLWVCLAWSLERFVPAGA